MAPSFQTISYTYHHSLKHYPPSPHLYHYLHHKLQSYPFPQSSNPVIPDFPPQFIIFPNAPILKIAILRFQNKTQ